jgi:hypothetical protein
MVTEVASDVVKRRWEREQALLGLARDTPDEKFAAGGLGALAVPPTVRVVVLPSDPCSQIVPGQDPKSVIPQLITLPSGRQLPHHETVRGTSSGYVGYSYVGEDGLWRSFAAVHWHGGVDFFLGNEGGLEWEFAPGSQRRVVYLRKSVGWAWGAFGLQGQMIERFEIAGPFRVIVGACHMAGAILGNVGAGWAEPGSASLFGLPAAVEPRVLLLEDLPEWPDAVGVEALALRFGSRLDLAFGGPGDRHLDRVGPDAGRFKPQW